MEVVSPAYFPYAHAAYIRIRTYVRTTYVRMGEISVIINDGGLIIDRSSRKFFWQIFRDENYDLLFS